MSGGERRSNRRYSGLVRHRCERPGGESAEARPQPCRHIDEISPAEAALGDLRCGGSCGARGAGAPHPVPRALGGNVIEAHTPAVHLPPRRVIRICAHTIGGAWNSTTGRMLIRGWEPSFEAAKWKEEGVHVEGQAIE